MRTQTGVLAMSLLFALALAGCGDDGPTGNNGSNCATMGTFNGAISGDVSTNMDGCALFGVVPRGQLSPVFGLEIISGSARAPVHLVVLNREGTRPGTGVYNVGTGGGDFHGLITLEAGADDRLFVIDAGTLTVTASSASGFNGSLNMTATEIAGSGDEITLTGTFQATCVDTSTTDC